jgi:hypothetical protein
LRTLSHLTAAVLLALGASPALGQSAPVKEDQQKRVEAERKAAEERARYAREVQQAHEKLKAELEAKARQLEALRDQLTEEIKRKAEAPKAQPPVGGTPGVAVRRVEGKPMQLSDPAVALIPLTRSGDPKVSALAAQLLEQLEKKGAPTTGKPMTARVTLTSESSKPGEPLKVVVVSDSDLKTTKTAEKTVKVPEAYSSLRMSADGKTAAVVAADGTVTVYDTASGKEMMKFPVKK